MKLSIKKTEMYMSPDKSPQSNRRSSGEAYRSATITDTFGMGKPTRTNPVGGFMGMQCFSGSPDQRLSPTSKPGNAGGKRII
jgi:hypothetical protein